jgi:hypothetical protein
MPPQSSLDLCPTPMERARRRQASVTYPLASRGLVAVTGRNEDDDSAESNGAGKTSLVTALLWAMKARWGRGWGQAGYLALQRGGSRRRRGDQTTAAHPWAAAQRRPLRVAPPCAGGRPADAAAGGERELPRRARQVGRLVACVPAAFL